MKRKLFYLSSILLGCLLPTIAHAQSAQSPAAVGVAQFQTILDNVYYQMMPLCAQILSLCQGIAALGATFYIAVRVWKHIARAEAIDFFPLLRPFVITLLISIFPQVLWIIDDVLHPTVTATAALVQHSNDAVQTLLIEQAAAIGTDTSMQVLIGPSLQPGQQGYEKYGQPDNSTSDSGGVLGAIGSGFKFLAGGAVATFRFLIKFLLSILLEVLYYAAALCISTIRTFHLIVLAFLGPFAFAFSVYDGFQQSLTHWLGRYINIYLWLPVANLFGAILGQIQQNMLQIDLARAQSGSLALFSPTDFAYLIFLAIGIVGYFTVPGITNYIVHTTGPNPIGQAINKMGMMAVQASTGGAGAATGAAAAGSGGGAAASGAAGGAGASAGSGASSYNQSKITG